MLASKTLSAPVRSVSMQCLATEPFQAQKTDLIAELKMSKDITGIKKMKVERAKMENMVDKEVYSEFTKQFTANNFVEKVFLDYFLIDFSVIHLNDNHSLHYQTIDSWDVVAVKVC